MPDEAARTLGELGGRRRQTVEMIGSERRRQLRAPQLVGRLEGHLLWLQTQLARVETEIGDAVRASPAWHLLTSVPGIGKTSARTLIAELPELAHLGRRQIASLVGDAPVNRDSSPFSGRRIVQGGRRAIRTALYRPTLTAIRRNSAIKAL